MTDDDQTRWEFEAHQQDDGSYLVTVPAYQATVAKVWESSEGVWSTQLYEGSYFRVGGAASKFEDQLSAKDAYLAIAKWGDNHIAVFTYPVEGERNREPAVYGSESE